MPKDEQVAHTKVPQLPWTPMGATRPKLDGSQGRLAGLDRSQGKPLLRTEPNRIEIHRSKEKDLDLMDVTGETATREMLVANNVTSML